MTSRRSTGLRGFTVLPVVVLPSEDAQDLLTRTVHVDRPDADPTDVESLCTEPDGPPLAIGQTRACTAHIRRTQSTTSLCPAKCPEHTFALTRVSTVHTGVDETIAGTDA